MNFIMKLKLVMCLSSTDWSENGEKKRRKSKDLFSPLITQINN